MTKGLLNITLLFSILMTASMVVAQDQGGSRGDSASNDRIADTLNRSGNAFRSGLVFLAGGDKSAAKREFDQATKVFIESGLRPNASVRFADCRTLLEETVFRLEYPQGTREPEIAKLFSVCGWGDAGALAEVGRSKTGPYYSSPTSTNGSEPKLLLVSSIRDTSRHRLMNLRILFLLKMRRILNRRPLRTNSD